MRYLLLVAWLLIMSAMGAGAEPPTTQPLTKVVVRSASALDEDVGPVSVPNGGRLGAAADLSDAGRSSQTLHYANPDQFALPFSLGYGCCFGYGAAWSYSYGGR